MFFTETFFMEMLLLILISLCLLNTSGYFVVVAALIYISALASILLSAGYQIAAIFLLLAEIHVIYIIFCLSLGWVHFDTITITTLESSTTNQVISAVGFMVLFGMLGSITLFTHKNSSNQLTLLFELGNLANFGGQSTGHVTTILNILAVCYLNTQLLEFYILNIFMFLAAYCYYKLRISIRALMITTSCSDINAANELFKKITTPIREQSQSVQLEQDYSVRCITLDNNTLETESLLGESFK